MSSRWPRDAQLGAIISLLAAAVLTASLLPVRDDIGLLNVGLLFLLLTLLVAGVWGRNVGILIAIITNLCLNFFFIEPLHTLSVQEPENVIALLIFLLVSVIGGSLLSAAREATAEARRRQAETEVALALSRAMIGQTDAAQALHALCEEVTRAFDAPGAAVLTRSYALWSTVAYAGAESAARFPEPGERAAAERAIAEGGLQTVGETGLRTRRVRVVFPEGRREALSSDRSVAFVPLQIGERTLGVLRLDGPIGDTPFRDHPQDLLSAVANEAALALERVELAQAASHAEALREADELKSALLNAVSHDLRTPLASIIASAESLQQVDIDWSEEEKREFAEAIQQQSERLDRLVGNLLDLSRIESGSLRPDKGWYDIAALAGEVLGRLKTLTQEHRISLKVEDDLPPVSLDYIEIDEVLTNLVENAVKYAPAGSAIAVSIGREDGKLLISVSDEGPGLPDESLPRVFEAFYRVQGTKAKGTGLGLAVARGLVEAHGGRIWAENRPGGGARFSFSLPLDERAVSEAPESTRTSR